MRCLVRGVVAAAILTTAACSSGGVVADAPGGSTLATAPPTTVAAPVDLCSLLQGVADDADTVDESAPPEELERSLQGVADFAEHAARVSPPALTTDVEIVSELYQTLVSGLESSGWNWGAFTASDHALRVADIRSDPATGTALEAVSTWAQSNC